MISGTKCKSNDEMRGSQVYNNAGTHRRLPHAVAVTCGFVRAEKEQLVCRVTLSLARLQLTAQLSRMWTDICYPIVVEMKGGSNEWRRRGGGSVTHAYKVSELEY